MYKRADQLAKGDVLILRSGDVELSRTVTKVTVRDDGSIRIVHKLDIDKKPASIFTTGSDVFLEVDGE